MALTVERGGRELAPTAVAALVAWASRHGPATSLHAGDVGWHLRHDDADLEETIVVVRDGSEVTAVALVESSGLRPTLRPDRADDAPVAAAVGAVAQSLAERAADSSAPSDVFCDTPTHSALRAWLVARGWGIDPDPWVVLYRPLSQADADLGDRLAAAVATDDDVRDRVAVQFNAFQHSTFTLHRWHQMAAGPAYRRDLDLVRRDEHGVAVAGATAWAAEPGRVGILEPVGTHRDHVGRGHGRAVTLAAVGALARTGASGVTVQTPLSNTAAVRAYASCGLRTIDHLRSLRYPSPDS
jgi:ribosomal protein S18 acetylase RimI-like enzyme